LLETVEDARPDVVVHLAAKVGVRPSFDRAALTYEVNVTGFQHLLEACRRSDPSHLVVGSSSTVYADSAGPFDEESSPLLPTSPYAASKRMSELMSFVYHRAYGLNATVLRIFTTYGPRQRPDMAIHAFTRRIDRSERIRIYGTGSESRAYIYVDDCVAGLMEAVDRPMGYEIINIGRSRPTSRRELVEILSMHLDKPANIEYLPSEPGDMISTRAGLEKAERLLGFAPNITIEEGLSRFVAWYRAQDNPY
jgi:UDP-glucuronate 4-epimerase